MSTNYALARIRGVEARRAGKGIMQNPYSHICQTGVALGKVNQMWEAWNTGYAFEHDHPYAMTLPARDF